jgi:hypothetical protein
MDARLPHELDYWRRREFAGLFEEAPMFMALVHGPEHVVEFVNPGYRRLIGGREVVGRRLADELEDVAAQGYVAMLDELSRSGAPIAANGAKYTMQAVPGGPVVDRCIDFVLQPVREPGGASIGIFVPRTDVTDRVLAEVRRDALIRVTDLVRRSADARAIMAGACRVPGETLGASRVGFAAGDGASDIVHIAGNWQVPGRPHRLRPGARLHAIESGRLRPSPGQAGRSRPARTDPAGKRRRPAALRSGRGRVKSRFCPRSPA